MQAARKAGISYVSGDRKKDGILPNMSIFENMVMSIYPAQSVAGFLRFISRAKLDPIFEHETAQLATKMGDSGNLIGSLSGGNQQKILIARSFAENPSVMVLNDPARGIDVGAKLDLYRNLRDFVARGNGVVFLSSEIEEFTDLCSRVLVFRGGVVSSEFSPPFDTHVILNATFGRGADEPVPGDQENKVSNIDDWRPARNGERPAAKSVRVRPNLPRRLVMNQSGFMLYHLRSSKAAPSPRAMRKPTSCPRRLSGKRFRQERKVWRSPSPTPMCRRNSISHAVSRIGLSTTYPRMPAALSKEHR